jgi:hypothetical protein
MSYHSLQDDILEKAEAVEEETWKRHISAFINSFVVKDKRHRWHHLCVEKPKKARRDAHKMYFDLICCYNMDHEAESKIIERKSKGVFYDFSGEAWWLSPSDAFAVGQGSDSIFSMEEGKLGIYFWHEFEDLLCRR